MIKNENEINSQARILIVDDAPENVDILGDILKDYKRSVALNGERALKIAFGPTPPDIILLDIMMPGMDGFEVCQKLKENPATRDLPVIFITGRSEVEDETRGLTLGAVDFILKPISRPVVLARVKNHLELSLSRKKLAEQKEQLEIHNKFMTDSIDYAKRIQTAILPNHDRLAKLFESSFLIFRPKDIVSGDFFWFGQLGRKKIIAAVDCTGHGVPGAFMSMIGNTLLNDIVNVKKVDNPARILNVLDEGIIHELNKDVNESTFDGMDVAICVFDEENKTIQFSSAVRPLFYTVNDQIFEIKGDRKSIGDNRKKIEYTLQSIEWIPGAQFYMMSDGYVDQNNSGNVKFGSKRLKELLREIQGLTSEEQRNRLEDEFLAHKGLESQRDDVTVIGIQIK
jgi:phosphoserine phosphatase RsbU/P